MRANIKIGVSLIIRKTNTTTFALQKKKKNVSEEDNPKDTI